jgi:hypothetical protein
MFAVQAFAEVRGDQHRIRAAGWQTIACVHAQATAEKIAINHRRDTGALVRVRPAPGLTVANRHGDIAPVLTRKHVKFGWLADGTAAPEVAVRQ